jgi:hypothetical protein
MTIAFVRRHSPAAALVHDITSFAGSLPIAIAATFVATLALQTPAQAYSDEAVKDADVMFKQTTARFMAGEVERADLALAHYNLLDVKHGAGQLSHAGFCRAAKADLTIAAKAFEEPKDQVGEKQTLLDAIAGMDASRDKCQQASAAADALLLGIREPVYSDAAEKAARGAVTATARRYQAGTVSEADLTQAQYDLLNLKYAGKRISRATYCKIGVPDVVAIATGIKREAQMGQRSLAEVIAAERRLYRTKAVCTAERHAVSARPRR